MVMMKSNFFSLNPIALEPKLHRVLALLSAIGLKSRKSRQFSSAKCQKKKCFIKPYQFENSKTSVSAGTKWLGVIDDPMCEI